jgi:hypothetical protein
MKLMAGQRRCGLQTMLNMSQLKKQMDSYNKFYNSRLRAFISSYEEEKSKIFESVLNKFDFIKNENVSFIASGLPFFMIDILNKRLNEEKEVKYLNRSKKIINENDGLREITFLEGILKKENIERQNNIKTIKLIDYSPLIKSTYNIIKEHFENLSIEYHNKNVNFEDIRDITKDSLVIIPYSEYLYILNELNIFNKGQYVLIFNQKDDDEKRKINTVLCIEDLVEQCGFSETLFAEKYDLNGIKMYLALGKI